MVAQGQRALGCLISTFKRQVCGVNCDEMDLVEANKYAFHAAAHTAFDGSGRTNGWGGGNANRAFGSAEYGPRGSVIDTNAPFRVPPARTPVRPWSSPVPQVRWCDSPRFTPSLPPTITGT